MAKRIRVWPEHDMVLILPVVYLDINVIVGILLGFLRIVTNKEKNGKGKFQRK